MKEVALYVLVIFAIANAWVVYYFFVYKQNQTDQEHKEKMKKIDSIGSGYFNV
jgi:preprotein translocase subunit YajC